MKSSSFRAEAAVLTLVFLDMLGFGALLPDIQLRLEGWGAPGLAIGAVLSSTFVVQLAVSPAWGKLSDRVGRKPVLLLCTALSAASMLLYAVAHEPWMTLLSRCVAGAGAANVAIAQAYCADLAATGQKVAAMGRIGAVTSSGLIVGPALCGVLAGSGGNFLLGAVSGGASLLGLVGAALALPRVRPTPREEGPRAKVAVLWAVPGLSRAMAVVAVSWFALATLEGTFGRLIRATLGLGQFEFGIVFAFESLVGLVVQAWLVQRIAARFRTDWSLRSSYVLMGAGLLVFPFAPSFAVILAGSFLYALGSGIGNPTANALCSSLTPTERQGEMFGLLQACRSFGYVAGPSLGGALFDLWHAGPYVVSTGVCLVAALIVPVVRNIDRPSQALG